MAGSETRKRGGVVQAETPAKNTSGISRPLDWYDENTQLTDEFIGKLWTEWYRQYPTSLGHKLIKKLVHDRMEARGYANIWLACADFKIDPVTWPETPKSSE